MLPIIDRDNVTIEIYGDGLAVALPEGVMWDGVEEEVVAWHVSVDKPVHCKGIWSARQYPIVRGGREGSFTYALTAASSIP